MKTNKTGLIVFWVGAAYLLVLGWLASWWLVPMYKYTPPEQIGQTVWVPLGPLWFIYALAPIAGAILVAIGMSLHAEPRKSWISVIVGALIILSLLFPPTMEYSVLGFGLIGGAISALFIAIIWYWGKRRITLQGPAKTAADLQLIGYVFFFAAAITLCGVLGSPWHTDPGLYFPEKVIQAGSLPLKYSQGIKVGVYLVLGFLFNFLSHFKAYKAE